MPPPTSPVQQRRMPSSGVNTPNRNKGQRNKQALVIDDRDDPNQWLGFSLPSRSAPTPLSGPPRRSKRGDAWRGSAMTREKFVNASFRFVLKPTEMLTYGAHFADPDIAIYWPNILQILVPTFSSFSVAQGFVSSEADEDDDDAGGEEAAERRRRMEEEKQGRTCPICLSKPVAGRMTKCGHIFCFPCILHFIQLSDVPKSAACPICGDTIHEGMLKSVRYLDAETMVKAAQGDTNRSAAPGSELQNSINEAKVIDSEPSTARGSHRLHMRLLQRPQMTTMSLPPSPTWPSDAIPPLSAPWHFLPDVLTYSRFMLATPENMLSELNRELRELQAEWNLLEGDDLGRSFVATAREKVERQIVKVKTELMTPMVHRTEAESRLAWDEAVGRKQREEERRLERELKAKEREERKDKAQEDDGTEVPIEFLATTSGHQYAGPTVHVPANKVVAPNPMPPKRNKKRANLGPVVPATPPAQSYYFYQSSLGANVFLNPLDSRILLAQFESYSACPSSITFPTTGYDSATVTEDLRKRVKYLSHLPVGTEVVFVEADLSGIVSKEVLAQFEQPLKARRDKRRKRVRREDRDKRRAEQAERAKHPTEPSYIVPSALVTGGPMDPDQELAMALAQSRLDAGMPISAEVGAAFPLPSAAGMLGTSPTSTTARSPPSGGGSFAWAVHSRATSSNPIRQREQPIEGVEEAWSALGTLDGEEEEAPGRKKKGGKKGKKLVLGGGGGRRA